MPVLERAVGQNSGSFEVYSRDAIVRNLEALESNWKWTVPAVHDSDYPFKFSKQSLESTFIAFAENTEALQGVARRDMPRVSILFVLAGEIEVYDGRTFKTLRIPANYVASVNGRTGKKLTISPKSAWLWFQVPEAVLRQSFEELTGKPYMQEFVLLPTSFCQGGAHGLYQTLRQAENELRVASSETLPMLAGAYKQLALIKLFAKLPHNLTDAFNDNAHNNAPRQLLKAEAHMRKNLHDAVSLKDLANAANCSTRALQRMFYLYRGDTPMGILCNYRLAAAHDLIEAGKAESITDLAMSFQFSNPGRFSVLYKSAYGFSPSSALRFSREALRFSREKDRG
ncbi:MAG TPA: AraC family transcriptional regulator [Rhizobium sp.]